MTDYTARFQAFTECLEGLSPQSEWRAEFIFESLRDESLFGGIDQTLRWYEDCCAANEMCYSRIPLSQCRKWSICPDSGSIVHESGDFFRVDGIRVSPNSTREVLGGWDQPILTQVGFDGGILGLIRKRFSGVPHYLVEAKAEPGNYRLVQITTTIQATFSNLRRAHGGNRTPYAEYFLEPGAHRAKTVFEQWMSEDGGRLLNKRNKTMLVELDEDAELELVAPRYRWVGLFEMKELLLREDAIVAPHLRGILAIV